MTETIQEIYEKAYEEEYDNILIRDMQMRIENKIYDMAREYLEKLGLKYDEDSERFEGEITGTDYDMENEKTFEAKFKICLILKYPDIRINSNNPEFDWD